MSQLFVYKASAGSGKTYRLACEYIKQILKVPEDYRKILAVTFTNKATAEMKGRIVDELFNLSQGFDSGMANEIMHDLGFSPEMLQKRSQRALSFILHDYSLFSVSTIDSFVQRVIQALLWEIGEQGGAEIQIDTDPVLTLAADNLLDSASKSEELMRWLTIMGENLMDEGGSWDVRRKLISLGNQIFSESFRLMEPKEIELLTDRKKVEELKVKLQSIVNSIVKKIKNDAQCALDDVSRAGMSVDQFKSKKAGVMGFFIKCQHIDSNADTLIETTAKYLISALNDPSGDEWVTKEIAKNASLFTPIQSLVQHSLHPKLNELANYIESNRRNYLSAKLILKNLENLALIGDLWREVKEISQREGFLLLSDSGHLLREFVKDSDAPFVYEKVGNRFDSFMIDEFQDTSVVQWQNFKPLIENSLSQGSLSMLVGDVKQSIYRWRNGDWRILAQGVYNDFSHHGVIQKPLNTNWRSMPSIICFNNAFFAKAIELASNQIHERVSDVDSTLSELLIQQIQSAYSDINQSARNDFPENAGYVEVNLFEKDKNLDYNQQLSTHLPKLVMELRKRYKLGEIAILIRSKSDGQRVADMFLEFNRSQKDSTEHIHFMSQEGLYLKSSSVVRLVISAFRLIQTPNDPIYLRVIAKEMQNCNNHKNTKWHTIFDNSYLCDEAKWLGSLSTQTLQENFEAVVSRYQIAEVKGELAYLAELHEVILSQSVKGNADVSRFLDWWDENLENLSLSVPESPNAVSIITIHKSKGLEFPVVIIPYANWPFRVSGKTPLLWVSSDVEPFNMLPSYPIYSSSTAEDSYFSREAHEEKIKEFVDNLNLLYVAFTRPKNELYVFAPISKSDKTSNEIKSISNLMQEVILSNEIPSLQIDNNISHEGFAKYSMGNKIVLPVASESKNIEENGWKINSYGTGLKRVRVMIKQNSQDFFKSQPTEITKAIEHGKTMHMLFSLIINIKDVDKAIQKMISEGLIADDRQEELSEKVSEILSHEPFKDWFSGNWIVKSENSILTPSGKTYRPDRVMAKDKHAIIVDFKFGTENDKYRKQVGQYSNLLKEMGFNQVEGYLWYVDENKLIKV